MMRTLRSKFFVPAVLFSLATVSITFGDGGVRWMWRDKPWIAVLLGIVAAGMWILVFLRPGRLKTRS
ncbi:MAG: hypothetical protein BGO26_20065 [Actinobacteria bacterium 69-20]|jgi:hypothetical protein|nr:hypothetical protein [Actinomycetota bacterium]OJV24813.1 MAG: hypothetical protein BGO26_20065 [Actinobacteria bacterium 69-20]